MHLDLDLDVDLSSTLCASVARNSNGELDVDLSAYGIPIVVTEQCH